MTARPASSNVPHRLDTVSELGHGTTSLADYDVAGQLRLGEGLGRSGHLHTFSVGYGDKVTCTITNSRKAQVRS